MTGDDGDDGARHRAGRRLDTSVLAGALDIVNEADGGDSRRQRTGRRKGEHVAEWIAIERDAVEPLPERR
jgi:hypothetical protein